MIVRSVYEGWQVVFHTSHGLLAQRLASQLAEPRTLPFWFETQVAIGLHDDMHRVYEPGHRIEEAYRKHTWIGLFQSKHADNDGRLLKLLSSL